MTAVLRDLPFQEEADEVAVGLERLPVKPYQIIVWVSVTARGVLELPPHAPRFPAILDTGHSHNFPIQERYLADWAQVAGDLLPRRGTVRVAGRAVPLHAAAVWLHPNLPGRRDRLGGRPPCRLELPAGIALYPRGSDFPRLPLLGLRALVSSKLHFAMDPERLVVNVRTPGWRTRLLRWLW